MKQVTVIFPIGGKAQRFGGRFKPFLKIFDCTFLELAIKPFLKHRDSIKEVIFLTTREQDEQFSVHAKIASFILPFNTVVFGTETADGIIADINKLIGNRSGLNDVIFCDCDHTLNVDAIFEAIKLDRYDVIIPGWEINRNERKSWSVAAVSSQGMVLDIKEKEYPDRIHQAEYYGVIGCYYFKRFDKVDSDWKYISDAIKAKIRIGQSAKLIPITEAEFFGNPERLQKLYEEKKASTIFCDLDGTIIKHENIPDYTEIKLLEGAGEKIEEWRCHNCFIVLTTSRDEQFRPEMERLLRKAGIKYEYLIMGLPPGTRHLINDKKPYSEVEMAVAHQVKRDEGIKSVKLNQIGHSFAEYSAKGKIAYKILPDTANDYQKAKFKAQYESMNRIFHNPTLKHLVPPMYSFGDNSYGMEQLEGYRGLDKVNSFTRNGSLGLLFKALPKLYSAKLPAPDMWLENYLDEKIFAKKEQLEKLGLDTTEVYDLISTIPIEIRKSLSPQKLCERIHGDLTYENILVKPTLSYTESLLLGGNNWVDIKLIDFDNDDKPGAPEMDLGKLIQSCMAGYEHWDTKDFVFNKEEYDSIIDFFSTLLNQDRALVENKALFYCACHLFRMLPYQAKTSMIRANTALYLCKSYLQKLHETFL